MYRTYLQASQISLAVKEQVTDLLEMEKLRDVEVIKLSKVARKISPTHRSPLQSRPPKDLAALPSNGHNTRHSNGSDSTI